MADTALRVGGTSRTACRSPGRNGISRVASCNVPAQTRDHAAGDSGV